MAKKKRSEDQKQDVTGSKQGSVSRYQTVAVLPIAAKEGWEILTPGQYLHAKDLIKQLVGFGVREFDSKLRIEQIGDFWELKDKGGTLGRINLRIYFRFAQESNEIVILKTYKKEDDGSAPPHIVIGLKNRFRQYLDGQIRNIIKYEPKK